ncbi:MAG: Nif3-like dinuclear metal center hexameric protein, partial [Clostridiales bacterium]|nr:Nif3-like dinuclear metal center hexameric protein [Clostridiales bacterium]
KIEQFVNMMEEVAQINLALSFDNVGLLVGTDRKEIKKVLVALDCTIEVAREAIANDYDLVLCHHPLIKEPINRILPDEYSNSVMYMLIRNGIGMFAAHTNLDAANGGVNDVLANIFELQDVVADPVEGIGRVGNLCSPITLAKLIKIADERLQTKSKCVPANFESDFEKIIVNRVGVLGGSGGGDIGIMKAMDADVLITGEIKHSQAIEAATKNLSVIQAGHYETEMVVLEPLITRLQKFKSGVDYNLTSCESSSLR